MFADLGEFELPEFFINQQTKRLFQIYPGRRYSLVDSKIHIVSKQGWTTTLYYLADVIFVNCKNSKHSWWGICKEFQNNESIWELCNFEYWYGEDKLKSCSKIELFDNTKIKGAEHSEWDLPEYD